MLTPPTTTNKTLSCIESENAGGGDVSSNLPMEFTVRSNTSNETLTNQCRIDVNSKSITDDFNKKILYNRATVMILVGDCKICL